MFKKFDCSLPRWSVEERHYLVGCRSRVGDLSPQGLAGACGEASALLLRAFSRAGSTPANPDDACAGRDLLRASARVSCSAAGGLGTHLRSGPPSGPFAGIWWGWRVLQAALWSSAGASPSGKGRSAPSASCNDDPNPGEATHNDRGQHRHSHSTPAPLRPLVPRIPRPPALQWPHGPKEGRPP